MSIPELDYTEIIKSLKAFKNKGVKEFRSILLPDEYNVSLEPELIQYAMQCCIFGLPNIPKLNKSPKTEGKTAFVYDNPNLQVIAENLPKELNWEPVPLQEAENFQALSQYSKIINGCSNPITSSIIYLICAEESIKTIFWDCRMLSPFRFPVMGVSIPKYNHEETLEERFVRIISEEGLIPHKIETSERFLDFYWNELYAQPYGSFTEALLVGFLNHAEDPAFAQAIAPFQDALLEGLICLTKSSGAELAIRLFHPNWFKLFDPTEKNQTKTLAQLCLKLLSYDEKGKNLYIRHYNLKAYWNLYSEDTTIAFDILDTLEAKRAEFCAELTLVLWCMGETEDAKLMLSKEDLTNVEEKDLLHFSAVMATMLEEWELAKKLFAKMDKNHMEDNGKYVEKFFWQSLVYRKLGETELEEYCLEKARQHDPLFSKKEHLRLLTKPHSAASGNILLSIEDLPVINMEGTVA